MRDRIFIYRFTPQFAVSSVDGHRLLAEWGTITALTALGMVVVSTQCSLLGRIADALARLRAPRVWKPFPPKMARTTWLGLRH